MNYDKEIQKLIYDYCDKVYPIYEGAKDDDLRQRRYQPLVSNIDKMRDYDVSIRDKEFVYFIPIGYDKALNGGTTSIGFDINDITVHTRVENFNKTAANAILSSNSIIKAYNEWITGDCISRILNNTTSKSLEKGPNGEILYDISDDPAFNNIEIDFAEICNELRDFGWNESKLIKFLKDNAYYVSDNEFEIRDILTMRLQYDNYMCKLLSKMVRFNYESLFFAKETAESLANDILSEDQVKKRNAIIQVKENMMNNPSAFLKNNSTGYYIDLKDLTGCHIFITNEKLYDSNAGYLFANYGDKNKNNYSVFIDNLLQKSFEYDCIIQCHGRDGLPIKDINRKPFTIQDAKGTEHEPFITLAIKHGCSKQFILNTYYDGTIKNKGELPNRMWRCQPLIIGGKKITIVDDAVAEAILMGYKRILVSICNDEHHDLNPLFNNIRGVKVNYSIDKLIFEDIEEEILKSENELIEFAMVHGIDYYSDDNEYLSEGNIVNSLKGFAVWVVNSIIKLFKLLWDLIKKLFNKIKNLFSKNNSDKLKEQLLIPFIKLSNNKAEIVQVKIKSLHELERYSKTYINNIQSEIKKFQNKQISDANELLKLVSDYDNKSI